MKVFINPGHGTNDPGACGFGLKESEVAAKIGAILESKLNAAGIKTKNLQSDDLGSVPIIANEWGADIFVSIHCNAANAAARGTEVLIYRQNSQGAILGQKVQDSIVSRLGTVDRGLKERPGLIVLYATDMPPYLLKRLLLAKLGTMLCFEINKKILRTLSPLEFLHTRE